MFSLRKNQIFPYACFIIFLIGIICFFLPQSISAQTEIKTPQEIHDEYVAFFREVYKIIEQNYYFPIHNGAFDRFLQWFDDKIYVKAKNQRSISNFIKWRSAAYMVDFLKSPEDKFSAFIPPKYAQKFEQKVLGKRIDLGIEGRLEKEGYFVTRIEYRSDAYSKGLREEDIVQLIDNIDVLTLTNEKITEALTPLENSIVNIAYLDHKDKGKKTIDLKSQEYFKGSVFKVLLDVPGVSCLEIRSFNQKTSEDMERLLTEVEQRGDIKLILDLRGNPGGPPLAALEISSFFLPPNQEFAYFQKKGRPKATLVIPEIPNQYVYKGELAILVNEESGSASELFSGILQRHGRALLFGTNTAGQVLLKSMFNFEDGSMVLLVTARGHYPDGSVFDFNGLNPDQRVADKNIDLVHFAAEYLKNSKSKTN